MIGMKDLLNSKKVELLNSKKLTFIVFILFSLSISILSAQKVKNTNDDGPGSLREALMNVKDGGRISFSEEVSGKTIKLNSPLTIKQTSFTLDGGKKGVILDGQNKTQFFKLKMDLEEITFKNILFKSGYVDDNDEESSLTIFLNGGKLLFDDCSFEKNESNNGGAVNLFIFEGEMQFNNCTFKNNNGFNGGAVYVSRMAGFEGKCLVNHCTFANNSATIGGAMFIEEGATLNGCLFINNKAKRMGGAINIMQGGYITNSVFLKNSAEKKRGGAIYAYYHCELTNCTIAENHANGKGGGLFTRGNTTINNSIIYNNTTPDRGPDICYSYDAKLKLGIVLQNCAYGVVESAKENSKQQINAENITLVESPFNEPISPGVDKIWGTEDDEINISLSNEKTSGKICVDKGNSKLISEEIDFYQNRRISGSSVDIGAAELIQ